MIGHIGFHGPPENGSLEMGYSVFEPFRRQGIALEAALAMIAWACAEHGIRRFILSISPNNGQSLALAEKMGFHRIGEQMDEEDGLEYVFERVLDSDD
jgi:ribosomal-protein-alanine N-acetyltransferase